ncbi:MAG: T9SS type A sorting domain-containing protein [Bacteroidetes bacterium]|nr:T9SS type A sorting domain-containing protein [Bacteroidota bacterium]
MKKLTVLILFVLPMMLAGQNPSGMLRSAIFDFQIGDEFHFIKQTDGYSSDSAFVKKTVTNKWTYTDSVCYEVSVLEMIRPMDPKNYTRTNTVVNECYGRLGEAMKGPNTTDSIKQGAFFGKDIFNSFSSDPGNFDYDYTYAVGLGEIKNNVYLSLYNDVHYTFLKMTWYSKGSESNGVALDFTVSTSEILKDIPYTVQNNSMIFIENIEVVNVFTLQGQVVFSDKNTSLVNLNDLNTGIYLVSVSDGQSISTFKYFKN